jgi:quinoprotein glucose dehydrogenase
MPTKPPPFDLQGATEENLIDFTPELRAEALEIVKRYTMGPLFTPPTVRDDRPGGKLGTIELPGSAGAASWTGGAFDPETHILYVPSSYAPFVADLEPGDPSRTNLRYVKGRRMWGPAGPRGLPLFKPPYGRITAIDMNKGEHVFQIPNGPTPKEIAEHPKLKGLDIPPTGRATRAPLLVTKTLLFAAEGWGGAPALRAHDKATGEVLAEIPLPGAVGGLPMTYAIDGKQFIVLSTAGERGAQLVALSLPN